MEVNSQTFLLAHSHLLERRCSLRWTPAVGPDNTLLHIIFSTTFCVVHAHKCAFPSTGSSPLSLIVFFSVDFAKSAKIGHHQVAHFDFFNRWKNRMLLPSVAATTTTSRLVGSVDHCHCACHLRWSLNQLQAKQAVDVATDGIIEDINNFLQSYFRSTFFWFSTNWSSWIWCPKATNLNIVLPAARAALKF